MGTDSASTPKFNILRTDRGFCVVEYPSDVPIVGVVVERITLDELRSLHTSAYRALRRAYKAAVKAEGATRYQGVGTPIKFPI